MRLSRDVLPAAQARTLTALIRVYNRDGRATMRTVAAEADRNVSVVFGDLQRLRRAGLVAWTDGETGTLRPLYWPAALVCASSAGKSRVSS